MVRRAADARSSDKITSLVARLAVCARADFFSAAHAHRVARVRDAVLLLVLGNRYDLPIVEFKMARRQGATREHVLCDL